MIDTQEQNPAQTEEAAPLPQKAQRHSVKEYRFLIHTVFAVAAAALLASGYILAQPYMDRYLPKPPDVTTAPVTTGESSAPVTVTEPVSDTAETTKEITTEETKRTRPVFVPGERADCILPETEDAGEKYLDRIVFLGDSRTYGLKTYKMLKDGRQTEQVWVPASGTLQICDAYNTGIQIPDGTEVKLRELVRDKKPDILVISLGINYVNYAKAVRSDEEDFKFWYRKLLDMLTEESPDTILVIGGILPVNETVYDTYDNNTLVQRNNWLLDLAYEYGLYYLNLGEDMTDEYGDLLMKYQNGDGCHPGVAGYTAILNYVRTHAVPDGTKVPDTSEGTTAPSVSQPATTIAPPDTTSSPPATTASPAVSEPASPTQGTESESQTLPLTQGTEGSEPPASPSETEKTGTTSDMESSADQTSTPGTETESESVYRRFHG